MRSTYQQAIYPLLPQTFERLVCRIESVAAACGRFHIHEDGAQLIRAARLMALDS
jgi:hypothetical protein